MARQGTSDGKLFAIENGKVKSALGKVLPIWILGFFSYFLESEFCKDESRNPKGLSAGSTPTQRRNSNSFIN